MQRRVERELADADAVLLVVNGEQGIGPGDRFIAHHLLEARPDVPVICAVNKIDRLDPAATTEVLAAAAELDGRRRGVPGLGQARDRDRAAHRQAGGADAGGPAALSARGAHRPAERGPPRRADPRAGPAAHPRGAAARGRGGGPGGRRARGRPGRGPRPGLGGDRLAEGDPDRQGRADGPRDRHRRAQGARARARRQGLPRPQGSRARALAPRRGACSTGSASTEWAIRPAPTMARWQTRSDSTTTAWSRAWPRTSTVARC